MSDSGTFKNEAIFGAVGTVLLILVLSHYAWIMRQLVINPNRNYSWYMLHGGIFIFHLTASFRFLLTKVYPWLYKDYIKEQEGEEKKKQ